MATKQASQVKHDKKAAGAKATLEALEQLAERLGVAVCYEAIVAGSGGLCRVRGQYRVIVDRRHGDRERVQALAAALCRFDLSAHDLPDTLRPLFPESTAA